MSERCPLLDGDRCGKVTAQKVTCTGMVQLCIFHKTGAFRSEAGPNPADDSYRRLASDMIDFFTDNGTLCLACASRSDDCPGDGLCSLLYEPMMEFNRRFEEIDRAEKG